MPTIHQFPAWTEDPLVNKLYLAPRCEGWSYTGSRDLKTLESFVRTMTAGDVLHVHWTDVVCQAVSDAGEGQARLETFQRIVRLGREAGVRLLWSVYSVSPRRLRHPELELSLRRFLGESADRVVVLNRHAVAEVAEMSGAVADRVVALAHPGYLGTYPVGPSQEAARMVLGLPPNSAVVAVVGRIADVRSILNVCFAVRSLRMSGSEIALAIAGRYPEEAETYLDELAAAGVPVVRHRGWIPSDSLGTWYAAADVVVLPDPPDYSPGRLMLAATFERPCAIPSTPPLEKEFRDESWVISFGQPAADEGTLDQAIQAAIRGGQQLRAAARDYARVGAKGSATWEFLGILADLVLEKKPGATE